MAWRLEGPPQVPADSYSFKTWVLKVWQYLQADSNVVSVSTAYSAKMTDKVILVDATAGSVTVTLPVATGNMGKTLVIIKSDSGGNSVVASRTGTESVNGGTTVSTTTKTDVIRVVSDNSNWFRW